MPIGRLWAYRHSMLNSYEAECYFVSDESDKKETFDMFNHLLSKSSDNLTLLD